MKKCVYMQFGPNHLLECPIRWLLLMGQILYFRMRIQARCLLRDGQAALMLLGDKISHIT